MARSRTSDRRGTPGDPCALAIFGARQPFDAVEVAAVSAYLDQGGRLFVGFMHEPEDNLGADGIGRI